MRHVFGLLLISTALTLSNCGSESFTEVERTRSLLLPGFVSYSSRKEIASKLPPQSEIKVIEETSLAKDNSIPPYRIHTVSVSPYTHLDQRGKLLITLYNDRLLQTAFYPENIDEYVAALKKSGTAVAFGQELVSGHTTIWIGIDFDNNHYVGWADKRLREQQRRWLARYS